MRSDGAEVLPELPEKTMKRVSNSDGRATSVLQWCSRDSLHKEIHLSVSNYIIFIGSRDHSLKGLRAEVLFSMLMIYFQSSLDCGGPTNNWIHYL